MAWASDGGRLAARYPGWALQMGSGGAFAAMGVFGSGVMDGSGSLWR